MPIWLLALPLISLPPPTGCPVTTAVRIGDRGAADDLVSGQDRR
jgi:hypothetical protein